MQDAGYGLPRTHLLLGTWVNKGKKRKGRGETLPRIPRPLRVRCKQ
jgi:hypothetical protein